MRPSTEPESNALQQIFSGMTVNRGRRRRLLYSAIVVLVLWMSKMPSTSSEVENSMKRARLEPTATCDDLLVESADGAMPQATSPKSSSDPDRETPVSSRLEEVVAYRNATSLFRS